MKKSMDVINEYNVIEDYSVEIVASIIGVVLWVIAGFVIMAMF